MFLTSIEKCKIEKEYIIALKKRKSLHPLDVISFLKALISFMGIRDLHSDLLELKNKNELL